MNIFVVSCLNLERTSIKQTNLSKQEFTHKTIYYKCLVHIFLYRLT